MARERAIFVERNPKSALSAQAAKTSLFGGVPMHWMADWPTPFPLFVDKAKGARFTDIDGHDYVDFCLGDTGAMFGHAPDPVAAAIREQADRGYTTMLPSDDAAWVGQELGRRFGLPYWQVAATATDANRYALRWARAITGRSKILVFDGCYHGTVEETLVRLHNGKTIARPGQLGAITDFTNTTRVVEFNDLSSLERELASGDIAAVLAEPAMTNIGMVLPDPGFHDVLRSLTHKHETLLIIDETHTISAGPGGWTKQYGLQPDILTLGKSVAGGIACAVFGVTATTAERMSASRDSAGTIGHGHSGMGTTLSGNAFVMHAMRANLAHVMTESAYTPMIKLADRLRLNLEQMAKALNLEWSVSQIGARCEFQFGAKPPRNGREAEASFHENLEKVLHLSLLNKGIMITPFHNMMLICPFTQASDVDKLVLSLAQIIEELNHA